MKAPEIVFTSHRAADLQADVDTFALNIARAAWGRMMLEANVRVYLYVRPSTSRAPGSVLALTDADEVPSDARLVTGQHVPRNRDVRGMAGWIRPLVRRLPLLPTGRKEVRNG